jgi:hypothetical protein
MRPNDSYVDGPLLLAGHQEALTLDRTEVLIVTMGLAALIVLAFAFYHLVIQ